MVTQGTVRSKKGNGSRYLGAAVSSKSESPHAAYPSRDLVACGPLAADEFDALATICHEVRYAPKQPILFESVRKVYEG